MLRDLAIALSACGYVSACALVTVKDGHVVAWRTAIHRGKLVVHRRST